MVGLEREKCVYGRFRERNYKPTSYTFLVFRHMGVFSVYSLSLSYIPVGYSRYSPIGYTGLPVGYLLAIYP